MIVLNILFSFQTKKYLQPFTFLQTFAKIGYLNFLGGIHIHYYSYFKIVADAKGVYRDGQE